MRKSLTESIARRIFALALTVAWATAPALPALACTLAGLGDAPMQVAMPDCHGDATASHDADATAQQRPRHPCCSDAETSCCLRALDVDGAVSGLSALEPPSVVALPAAAPIVPSLDVSLAAFAPVLSPDASPPACRFRVLRL